ncbi:hypothetical protein AWC38_SpisGene25384, partial [Stylophora pistillata]
MDVDVEDVWANKPFLEEEDDVPCVIATNEQIQESLNYVHPETPIWGDRVTHLFQELFHIFGSRFNFYKPYQENQGRHFPKFILNKFKAELKRSGWEELESLENRILRDYAFWLTVVKEVPNFQSGKEYHWVFWPEQRALLQQVIFGLQKGGKGMNGSIWTLQNSIHSNPAPFESPERRDQAVALLRSKLELCIKACCFFCKIGAAPETVLRRLAETHSVSGVMDLEEYGLLNDFVSSEVKLLGTEDFIQNPHQVLEGSEVSIYEESGGTKDIVITVYQPTQELSVTDTLNGFFAEKLPALQPRFTATTVQELRRVSGVEDLEVDSLEGTKISLAIQQYEWLKIQFNRASNEDEKGLCTVGAICVMGMCPTSSDRMFFETTWTPWEEAFPLLQRTIEGLANHPDNFVKA